MRRATVGLIAVAATMAVAASPSAAATFTNTTPIAIPTSGAAAPYPSPIAVAGLGGTITDVNVTTHGLAHTFPDEVGVVLVGPTGAALLLQNCAGDDADVSGVTTTFDDSAAQFLPETAVWASGSYKPTDHCATADPFPSPGPGTAYARPGPVNGAATLAPIFNGTAANGTWNLFVADFVAPSNSGAIAGGWSLDISTTGDAGGDAGACLGKQATIAGTPGADTLRGTSGRDVIKGRGGADRISGLGGRDLICGGSGKDRLGGGAARDTLVGGAGADLLLGGEGRDKLIAGTPRSGERNTVKDRCPGKGDSRRGC